MRFRKNMTSREKNLGLEVLKESRLEPMEWERAGLERRARTELAMARLDRARPQVEWALEELRVGAGLNQNCR